MMEKVQTADKAQNRSPRDVDTRMMMQRPTAWRPPETLPSPDPRPGWTHRWVRISVMGQTDASNRSSKFREGYEPVKAEEYPELMMHATTDGPFKGGIEVGGLLLCRIPSEFLDQRAAYYANQNKAQMESVDNNFLRDSDPRMPLFSEKKSKVTFGSGS
jgi:hypothetical protein